MDEYQPNIIHRTLARMEAAGRLSEGIYTQNIDGLHQRAGSRRVYELHGSLRHGFCTECGRMAGYAEMEKAVREGGIPICPSCGAVIKPDIVFYGESLDMTMLMRAENAFTNADLSIVLGSSLVVNPAASLPYNAVRAGKDIVIVNRTETYLDGYAALRFDDMESFFAQLSAALADA